MESQCVDEAMEEFRDKLIREFGDDLISVVVFGSQVKKPRWDSDIDILVVMDNLPENWRERDDKFYDLEYDVSVGHGVSISAVYYSSEEVGFGIKVRDRLFLGILLGYTTIYDRNGFFRRNIEKLRGELDKEHANYIADERVWHIPSMRLRA